MYKILVTGGSGFIGSNLVRLLVKEKGCTVINVDKLTYAGNPASLADLEGHPNYHFEQIDLAQPEVEQFESKVRVQGCVSATQNSNSELEHTSGNLLNAIFQKYKPDAVMHLAAESHVDRSIDGPGEFMKCLRGEPIPVYGKGENIRDWLYVTDHAEALYAVLTKGRVGETYNIGGNNERQNIELVRSICKLMDQFSPLHTTTRAQHS